MGDLSNQILINAKNFVYLSKQRTLRILAVCQQGDRSIDAVLHPCQANWAELRKYYTVDKQQLIRSAILDLGFSSIPPSVVAVEARAFFRGPSYFPFVTYAMNKLRTQWRFCQQEQAFFGSAFGRLLTYLSREQQPDSEDLMQLRLDLTIAGSHLENKLFGIRELWMVVKIEYYAPPAGKHLYSIREALQAPV